MDIIKEEKILDWGYKISNAINPINLIGYDVKFVDASDSKANYESPGITTIIEDCNDMTTLVEILKKGNLDDEDSPKDLYKVILNERYEDWKNSGIAVRKGYIWFDFVNNRIFNDKTTSDASSYSFCADFWDVPEEFRTTLSIRVADPAGHISFTTITIEGTSFYITKKLPYGYRIYEPIKNGCDFPRTGDGVKFVVTECFW